MNSNAKKVNKEEVIVTFADIAGYQEAKKEIMLKEETLEEKRRKTVSEDLGDHSTKRIQVPLG